MLASRIACTTARPAGAQAACGSPCAGGAAAARCLGRAAAAGGWQQHRAQQRRRPRRGLPPLRSAAEDELAEEDLEVSGGFCMPAFVSADNKRSQCFTVLDVEVGDYPGLLRVISWTLNGLDVVAQNAMVRTSEDGQAHNTFWLTDRSGQKLTDAAADLLAERVRDFVTYCSPGEETSQKTEFCAGPVRVSNSQHEQYTVVTVLEPRPTPGFLLEVASALSGMNIQILQGVVQGVGCEGESSVDGELALEQQLDEGICLVPDDTDGRVFKFWVRDSRGGKLDYGGMSALVYTVSSVLGYRSHPTVPPDQELLMSAH